MEAVARAALERVMIDPTSFLIRDIKAGNREAGEKAICGQVNGKNRMGAYTGFADFIVIEGGEPLLVMQGSEFSEAQFALLLVRYCGNAEMRDALGDKWFGPREDENSDPTPQAAAPAANPSISPSPAPKSFVRDGVRHLHAEDEQETMHGPYEFDYDDPADFEADNRAFWEEWDRRHVNISNGS